MVRVSDPVTVFKGWGFGLISQQRPFAGISSNLLTPHRLPLSVTVQLIAEYEYIMINKKKIPFLIPTILITCIELYIGFTYMNN